MATSKTSKASSMAELMARGSGNFKTFKKSDLAEGTITKLTSAEILVDIGAKTEAVVFEKERGLLRSLLSALHVGDHVTVSILNPESDFGNPVVSLRRFMDDRQWKVLEDLKSKNTPLEITVTDTTRGGFLVDTDLGKQGFLPNSHSIFLDSPESFIGKRIKASVVDLNRAQNKIIFSQKATIDSKAFQESVKGIKEGQHLDPVVSNATPFGIFVSFQNAGNTIEGYIHSAEVSWDRVPNIEELYKSGEKIEVVVLGIDHESKRVNLSMKRLTLDPFEERIKDFPVDRKVKAEVSQVADSGVTLRLSDEIEGFIKKEKIPPTVQFKVGQEIEASVSEIDKRRHRIILVPVLLDKPIGYR